MKAKKISYLFLVLLLTLTLCLCACNAAEDGNANYENNGGFDDYENFEEKLESPEAGDTDASLGLEGVPGTGTSLPTDRKIIKTYDVQAETKSFSDALTKLRTLITEKSGYVESSHVSDNGYDQRSARYATYTIRIPAEHAEAFVSSMGDILNVTSNQSNVADVSETYYSIEATLEELETERDSLLAMMESLDNQKDYNFWLTLQQRLSAVKQQIAVYQRQLMNYDNQVAYSTVHLSIREVVSYTPAEEESFGTRLGNAFVEGWSAFATVLQDLLILFVTVFPFLLIPLLGGSVVLIVLHLRKKKENR